MVSKHKQTTPLPGFKMTDLGPLPEEWRVVRLGEVATKPQYGYTASATEERVGPKFLRITDIQNDQVQWHTVPFCAIESKDFEKYRLREGDILFARIGATTGKTYLVTEPPEAVFASYLIRVCTDPKLLLPDYLYFFTHTSKYWHQINAAKGGRLKQGINIPVLTSMQVPLPPLSEQRAIAYVLKTVQEAREATERVIAALRDLKRSLMRHLFTYGPVPVDAADQVALQDTPIGPIPAHWRAVRLGEVCNFRGGTQPPKSEFQPIWRPGFVRLLQIRDFETDEYAVYVKDSPKLRKVDENDVLIGRYGASVGRILRGKAGAINVAIVQTIPNEERLLKDYLYYLLSDAPFQQYVRNLGGRSAQAGFNQGELKRFLIPLPPLDEQREIARILQTVDRKIEAEEARKEALNALFRSLLHHLMTAKIRLPADFIAQFEEFLQGGRT